MKVENNTNLYVSKNKLGIENLYMKRLSNDQIEQLREQVEVNAHAFTFKNIGLQNQFTDIEQKFIEDYHEFQSFLDEIGYEGGAIASLSQEEAAKLVSEDGIFGVNETSQRLYEFVFNGANGDEDLLRAGREGMLKGFAQARELWGGELPEISQKTITKTLELLDNAISGLGYSLLDKEV